MIKQWLSEYLGSSDEMVTCHSYCMVQIGAVRLDCIEASISPQ